MEIINAHIHLGGSRILDTDYSEELLCESMEREGVTGICVMPFTEPYPDNFQAHTRIYEFAQANPHRGIWGIADMHPRHDEDVYRAEVERCVKELGFIAIKLHPCLQAVNPNSSKADKVFEAARDLKVPLLVHTGLGAPAAVPSLMIPRALQYPDLPIVLCHAGNEMYAEEALIAAELCENIYLEPSFVDPRHMKKMMTKLGKERLLFGTDGPWNIRTEISKAESAGFTDDELEWYFSKTARQLFQLK